MQAKSRLSPSTEEDKPCAKVQDYVARVTIPLVSLHVLAVGTGAMGWRSPATPCGGRGAWPAADEAASITRSSGAGIGARPLISPRKAYYIARWRPESIPRITGSRRDHSLGDPTPVKVALRDSPVGPGETKWQPHLLRRSTEGGVERREPRASVAAESRASGPEGLEGSGPPRADHRNPGECGGSSGEELWTPTWARSGERAPGGLSARVV
ncbi:hypothetical protein NDU88_009360 [Pleurodeles waltl]|uniref:Uncharacterized protein n=1 Tax=Pleurodeles waltl TaxID=8319 RepID=A0AAV7QSF2_PLEWA|nr:hypothetical protein NDU88_009360 [Pleurodeles waltl]